MEYNEYCIWNGPHWLTDHCLSVNGPINREAGALCIKVNAILLNPLNQSWSPQSHLDYLIWNSLRLCTEEKLCKVRHRLNTALSLYLSVHLDTDINAFTWNEYIFTVTVFVWSSIRIIEVFKRSLKFVGALCEWNTCLTARQPSGEATTGHRKDYFDTVGCC